MLLLIAAGMLFDLLFRNGYPEDGMSFLFKNQTFELTARPQTPGGKPRGRTPLGNWYDAEQHYVEIIRQDHASSPRWGLALGFEFNAEAGEYPYHPAHAVMQLKDFGWGGLQFGRGDTCNYTGVLNDFSEDLSIRIDTFSNDTIYGRFSGLLLSGAGSMASIEDGYFRVRLYRK